MKRPFSVIARIASKDKQGIQSGNSRNAGPGETKVSEIAIDVNQKYP